MTDGPKKDEPTVDPAGRRLALLISGVVTRPALTIPDDRGTICEVYNPAWGVSDAPLVYVYQVTIRPGQIKGWVKHTAQTDRLFFSLGTVRVVLYDDRSASPTHGMVNELFIGEHNRGLVTIPENVYHAIQNVGSGDALCINMPTRPYEHANPDKYRLPLDTPLIPYRFEGNPRG
ncbi:MAG: dTDP-4-dehydrorhamnose 3,5-epimerase family protein [Chloroflexota bacterium]